MYLYLLFSCSTAVFTAATIAPCLICKTFPSVTKRYISVCRPIVTEFAKIIKKLNRQSGSFNPLLSAKNCLLEPFLFFWTFAYLLFGQSGQKLQLSFPQVVGFIKELKVKDPGIFAWEIRSALQFWMNTQMDQNRSEWMSNHPPRLYPKVDNDNDL